MRARLGAEPQGAVPARRLPLRAPAPLVALCLALSWPAGVRAQPQAPDDPVVRETRREFFDSLSDQAIAPDPTQLYRRNGARREVDLGHGWTALLDERPATRFDSPVAMPGVANRPSRVLGLQLRRPTVAADITHGRTSVTRETGAAVRWSLLDRVSVIADWREQRSIVETLDARREDGSIGLRWLPEALAGWVDIGVHHASLSPATDPPAAGVTTPDANETFWRARARWSPQRAPGLGLGAVVERAVSQPTGPFGGGRFELGADYTLQPDNPLGPAFTGARLHWREAPRLGLLSDGQALEASAAYRRTVGIEVPDGTPGGSVYSQWRSRSVASDDDSIWVLGWRRALRPSPRWLLQGFVEQATPLGGPNAVRSFSIGGRLWRGAFPENTFVTDLQLVNSERDDSLYTAVKYTWRLADDWVAALRGNVNHTRPHDPPAVNVTTYKTSFGVGWREPSERRLALLGRWTFTGTDRDEAAQTDRRAHIVLGAGNYIFDADDSASARWTHRWERDETRPQLRPRQTTLMLGRWVHDLRGRWSLSAHLAHRRDDLDGSSVGAGAEIGYQLSRKVTLALGWNPRGIDDHELEVDERLDRGLTLRLRLSIDAALSRWLDAPRPAADGGGER